MCRLSWNLGDSTSWNPQGLSRPLQGLLYLLRMRVRQFVAGLSSRLLMFEPVHVGFGVEKVALEQACLRVLRFSPVVRSSHQRSIFVIWILWNVTPSNFFYKFPTFWTDVAASCSWDCCMVTKWVLPFEASAMSYEWAERYVPKALDLHEHRVWAPHTFAPNTFNFKSAFNRTTNGRSLGTHQKSDGRSEIEGRRGNEGAFVVFASKSALI
jgi:hypothetical protein